MTLLVVLTCEGFMTNMTLCELGKDMTKVDGINAAHLCWKFPLPSSYIDRIDLKYFSKFSHLSFRHTFRSDRFWHSRP